MSRYQHTQTGHYQSLVRSVLLYDCESWTFAADCEKRITAFEHECMQRLIISYKEWETNELMENVRSLVGSQERLISTIVKLKLKLYWHTSCHNTLTKTIVEAIVEGGWCRGSQHKLWADIFKEWTCKSTPELTTVTTNCFKIFLTTTAIMIIISLARSIFSQLGRKDIHWTALLPQESCDLGHKIYYQ